MDEEQYEETVRGRLSNKHSQHSVDVVKAVQELAVSNGVDPKKARLTGILHDIIKEAPSEEQLKIADTSSVMFTGVERYASRLWHAMVGVAYLRCVLGIEDQETLDVVRYHITGCANMPLLEKIVFVADPISDGRDYGGVQELRGAVRHGLQEAVMAGLISTIQDLSRNQRPTHPDGLAVYSAGITSHGEK